MGLDPKTFALAKPKIIDLGKFYADEGGGTFSERASLLLGASLSNGGMAHEKVEDMNGALKQALTASIGKQLIFRFGVAGAFVDVNATLLHEDGVAFQLGGAFPFFYDLNLGILDVFAIIQFYGGDDTSVDMYVKATSTGV